ncbi:gastrin-releasing peptide [Poeciliopsis prolifica]|uniref:gastrin-releasing peptide n=1 Tax=Poeciliopsis prolifica TaxID=188132 RepID=UPI0024131288|nr:gastrin-releasing peptide [Poeciliopsis prolifica]
MCAGRLCYSWSCRALWPVFIILAAAPCLLRCAERPAASVVGKMYPRGNHWAVGHLMGKKSITSLPARQQEHLDYLTLSQSDEIFDQDQTVKEMSAESQEQTVLRKLLHSNRRDNRGKHLREVLDLLILTLKQRDSESS